MAETLAQSKKIEWKTVAVIFLLYVVFYMAPIVAALDVFSDYYHNSPSYKFLGIWFYCGIIVVSFTAVYFSKTATLREPAIASSLLFVVCIAAAGTTMSNLHKVYFHDSLIPMMPTLGAIFFLSILGAWLGNRVRKLKKSKTDIAA